MSPVTVRSSIAGAAKALMAAGKKVLPTADFEPKKPRLHTLHRWNRYYHEPTLTTRRVSGLNDKTPTVREKIVTRPQILLCNWQIVLCRPGNQIPDNQVLFKVEGKMTKFDIKNYIEALYKVPVKKVETSWQLGKSKRNPAKRGLLIKHSDFKRAYVTLGDGYKFRYPDDPLEFPPDEEDIVVPTSHPADDLDVE